MPGDSSSHEAAKAPAALALDKVIGPDEAPRRRKLSRLDGSVVVMK